MDESKPRSPSKIQSPRPVSSAGKVERSEAETRAEYPVDGETPPHGLRLPALDPDNMPLPRFWYFPRGEKAVVLMTADDHSSSNVPGRFDQYKALSPMGCSVDDWECVRSSVYIYSGTTLSEAQANAYHADGFEIGVHVDTSCNNYTLAGLENYYTTQLSAFAARFPALPLQDSERTHCIAWSGWGPPCRTRPSRRSRRTA